jgi:hypothetical protein
MCVYFSDIAAAPCISKATVYKLPFPHIRLIVHMIWKEKMPSTLLLNCKDEKSTVRKINFWSTPHCL